MSTASSSKNPGRPELRTIGRNCRDRAGDLLRPTSRWFNLQNEVARFRAHTAQLENVSANAVAHADDAIIEQSQRYASQVSIEFGIELDFVNRTKHQPFGMPGTGASNRLIAGFEII